MTFSISEYMIDDLDSLLKGSDILLVGLTGGIASGKSTVARTLEKMGASVIDFDVLARKVVEPGKPSWKNIVSYFGGLILRDDSSIDRKKLSDIVFRDPSKRRKLEEFTYPFIAEEFIKKANEVALKDSQAIVLAVVPLLIEAGMVNLFHKVIVVHISREKQIDRLAKRDKISREDAINVLNAQMPIDEKIGYADFVIHNEGSRENTKEQTLTLWIKLKEINCSSR